MSPKKFWWQDPSRQHHHPLLPLPSSQSIPAKAPGAAVASKPPLPRVVVGSDAPLRASIDTASNLQTSKGLAGVSSPLQQFRHSLNGSVNLRGASAGSRQPSNRQADSNADSARRSTQHFAGSLQSQPTDRHPQAETASSIARDSQATVAQGRSPESMNQTRPQGKGHGIGHQPGGSLGRVLTSSKKQAALERLAGKHPQLFRALQTMQLDQHGRISPQSIAQVQSSIFLLWGQDSYEGCNHLHLFQAVRLHGVMGRPGRQIKGRKIMCRQCA